MTADPRPRHATSHATPGPVSSFAQAELFDVDAVPFATRDTRSVGEMLSDVDYQARQLLLNVDGDAAAGLLRGWPAMVAAAEELWYALPGRTSLTEPQDRAINRLAAQATSIDASLSNGWPGPEPPDPRITHLADTLCTAAALVRRYGGEIDAHSAPVRRDLEAARTRMMHGLYVTAHAVLVTLHAHGRDRYREARNAGHRMALSRVHSPYAVAPTPGWIRRFTTAETTAGDYLTHRFAAAVSGEVHQPLTDQHRIARALAGWDIQAHRSLATSPSAANTAIAAGTQALIAGVGHLLLGAAAHNHQGDVNMATAQFPDRLSTALSAAGPAWINLTRRWDDLRVPSERHDPQLMRAAAELRAAYHGLTHDGAPMANSKDVTSHPALMRALDATLAAIESGPALAEVLVDKANNPNLVGRARALSLRAQSDIEAGLVTPDPASDIVWVSPADIQARRLVPLPTPVAQTLRDASASVVAHASTAASAAASCRPSPCSPRAERQTEPDFIQMATRRNSSNHDHVTTDENRHAVRPR